VFRNRSTFDMMVHHVLIEEGLSPRNLPAAVSASSRVHNISSVITSSGHNQPIGTDKLTEGQQETEL